jgi:hypothetical protein
VTFTTFLAFCLATWRISSLLTGEDGPGLAFRKLRELAGIEHDDEGNIERVPEKFFAGVLSCIWCCSIWAALGWVVLWLISPKTAHKMAMVFAFSAGAIAVDRVVKV